MCQASHFAEGMETRSALPEEALHSTIFNRGSFNYVGLTTNENPNEVVCVSCGTTIFVALPRRIRQRLNRQHRREVGHFVLAVGQDGEHHDAIRFSDGVTVTLQSIGEGLYVRVKALPLSSDEEARPHELHLVS